MEKTETGNDRGISCVNLNFWQFHAENLAVISGFGRFRPGFGRFGFHPLQRP